MSKVLEQSVKSKIKNIIKENPSLSFNSLLVNLFLERYLVRVSLSKYKENLIFKGGMCLSKYLELGRYTKDIDFLLQKLDANQERLSDAINEISAVEVNDGFLFGLASVESLSVDHKKYPGYRISIPGQLGSTKEKLLIDIGVGDVVRTKILEFELMSSEKPLFERSVSMKAYPPEYIFSEKVEAIIRLGEYNSRMKDFYDCNQILENINSQSYDESDLVAALVKTFNNRNQTLRVIDTSAEVFAKNWNGFRKKNNIVDLDLDNVIKRINMIIKAALEK